MAEGADTVDYRMREYWISQAGMREAARLETDETYAEIMQAYAEHQGRQARAALAEPGR